MTQANPRRVPVTKPSAKPRAYAASAHQKSGVAVGVVAVAHFAFFVVALTLSLMCKGQSGLERVLSVGAAVFFPEIYLGYWGVRKVFFGEGFCTNVNVHRRQGGDGWRDAAPTGLAFTGVPSSYARSRHFTINPQGRVNC